METNLCKDNFSKLCSTQFIINHINHFLMLENATNFNSLFAVDPPSNLNFKIIDENTVHMSWERPVDPIVGYRITVDSTTGEFQDAEVLGQRYQGHTVCLPNLTFDHEESKNEQARGIWLMSTGIWWTQN